MVKYLLIFACIAYIFRRFFLMPIPGSKAFYANEQQKVKDKQTKKEDKNEYIDYEEIK